MKASTKMRVNQIIALVAVVTGFVLTFRAALDDALMPEEMVPRSIDATTTRDREMEALRARIRDLEEDLAAREEDCEHLADTLNGAVADRNEAIAILQSAGLVVPVEMPEEERPTEHAEDAERKF